MNTMVILLISLLVALSIVTYLYMFHDLSGSHNANFISTLTLIGTMVGAIIFIYQYNQSKNAEAASRLNVTIAELQSDWIDLETMFITNYPYLNRLYDQIYPNNRILSESHATLTTNEEIDKRDVFEVHMSTILFQIVENIYLQNIKSDQYRGSNPQNLAWINKFVSWFKSPILREQWQFRKKFYGSDTQQFVDTVLLKSENYQ